LHGKGRKGKGRPVMGKSVAEMVLKIKKDMRRESAEVQAVIGFKKIKSK
jgi:hypothetical protein